MSGHDELTDRLRAALDDLAGTRAGGLIREAEDEARAEVKELLRGELRQRMLMRAEQLLAGSEPAVPERQRQGGDSGQGGGSGCWLYCVVGEGHPGLPGDLDGVAAGHAPRILWEGGIGAVVSEAPLDEFGEDALRRNLTDLDWIETMARAHAGVLDAALSEGSILPMRVCTIYDSEDQVRAMLAERRETLGKAIGWLEGRTEWRLKMLADRERIDAFARDRVGAMEVAGPTEGSGYLTRKQFDRAAYDEATQIVDEVVRKSHARLEEWAMSSEILPPKRMELSGHDEGVMVFNGVYLVDDERIESFEKVLRELEAQYGDLGVELELTGPWPAHHFVDGFEVREPA